MSSLYRVDFDAANNEDLRQDFALTDAACQPLDLTGAALRMMLQPKNMTIPSGSAASLLVSTDNGKIVISDAPNGKFSLAIPASDMATLMPGLWEHDLLLIRTGDTPSTGRLWKGDLKLVAGITPAVLS